MNFYRKKNSELLTASADFHTAIAADFASLGLTSAQATAYGVVNTAFATAYGVATDPATRTSAAIEARNQARENLVTMAKQLSDNIINNPAVSNATLMELGLDPRRERTPIPPPTTSPDIDIVSVVGRTVKIRLHSAGSSRRGKPDGVNGVAIFSHAGATAPASINDWTFEGNSGKTIVDVVFPDTVAPGSLVWFTAFWFNNRKQSGPACDPVSINIAGGGVSMAA
jgi:hypothetical protein